MIRRMSAPSELVVRSLADLDAHLARIDRPDTPDDELRRELARLRLDLPEAARLRRLDPFSKPYRDAVLALLEGIRGTPYTQEREGLDVDVEHELRWGFPYGTQSFATVGGYLIAYGHLIRAMELPPGARILEVGCGTGSLSQHLRERGLNVLGVDFDSRTVRKWNQKGFQALYGDAEDPEFPSTLPLHQAQWVVSTIPQLEVNLSLLDALHHHGYQGQRAFTAHNSRDAEILKESGADLILFPFADAAREAADILWTEKDTTDSS